MKIAAGQLMKRRELVPGILSANSVVNADQGRKSFCGISEISGKSCGPQIPGIYAEFTLEPSYSKFIT